MSKIDDDTRTARKKKKRHLIQTPAGPMTRKEAADYYGIPRGTLTRRIWAGWPRELWFAKSMPQYRRPPRRQKRGVLCTPFGMMTIPAYAEKSGLEESAITTRRYVLKWSNEHALNTPRRGVPGEDFIYPIDEWRRGVELVKKEVQEQARRDDTLATTIKRRRKRPLEERAAMRRHLGQLPIRRKK